MKQLLRFQQNGYLGYFLNLGLSPSFKIVSFLCILLGTTHLAQAQCSISISKVTVSGCYLVGNQSKATVSVEVGWTNAPTGTGGTITVTLGTQTRTITPGTITVTYPQVTGTATGSQTIVTPQVVAFEIDANGSSNNTITAKFNNNCATDSETYNAPAACPITACSGNNVGGIVFKDFNDNGIKEAGETAGVASVAVKGIACDGTIYNAVTDGYGYYSLPVPANKYPVRVEFDNVPSIYKLGVNGIGSRTSVQFVSAPACNVNLGIVNPIEFCSDNNLRVFVPCFVYGDPLPTTGATAANLSGNADALVSFPYGVTAGIGTTNPVYFDEKMIAKASQIGTIWGLAYNKYTKRLFQSAVVKRHAGLGPQGLGGLYVTNYSNPASPTTASFVNVTTDLGINIGTIASNSTRGLQADKTQPSRDTDAFAKIGKVGMGDLDISEDGNTLWFVNMFDKKLYSVDITQFNQDGTTKPTAANVSSFTIPATCTGGEYRPWALKVYNGKVYVGGICDAQSSGNKSNLRASVYELSGNTFTQIFDFPLTYPKGYPAAANRDITGWYPWTDDFDDLRQGTSTALRYPVPMFTDIEFDIDGSMVLGFGDRTGWQGGDLNYRPDGTSTTLYETNSQAGDILRAFYANGTFVLENNAIAGPSDGYGNNNQQGPGFGEFYNDNWIQENGTVLYHTEEVIGGLALKPGSGQVVTTVIDPQDRHPYAGGVRYMNNTSGEVDGFYTVYITRGPDVGGTGEPNPIPGSFAKATGLGDIELSCDNLEIIEIGNRVWLDTDKDGVQDACEKGLKDVNVTLYKGTTKIATTKTDVNGEYYFSRKSKLTVGTWSGTGADTVVRPTTAYSLVFGTGGQITGTNDTLKVAGIGKFLLTQKDATANTGNDLNDSDAAKTNFAPEAGSFPIITFTTGTIATTNHTFDAGFYCIDPFNYKASATPATCTGITANSDAKIVFTDVKCADKYAFSKNSGGKFTGAAYAAATAFTGTTFTINNLANPATAQGDTFYVRLYNGLCCYKDTMVILPFKDCSCVKPVVTATPKNQAICQGSTITAYTANTTPSASITYKWYGPLTDTTGSLGTAISGQTNASFTPTASFTGKRYFAVVATGIAPICSDTAFVSLTINPRPVANATAKKQTICIGTPAAPFTATPATGVTYKWFGPITAADTLSGNLGTAIGGATNVAYTPTGTALTTVGTKYYAVEVTTTNGGCKDTAYVCLVVNSKPVAGLSTQRRVLCVGSGALPLIATPSTGVSYAWFGPLTDTTSSLGTAISGASSSSYTPTFAMVQPLGTKYFAVVVTNSSTSCKDTAFVGLTTKAPPKAGITPKKQEICVGETPVAFIATPSTGVTYQWYGPIADTTGSYGNTLINGATSASFTPNGTVIKTPGTYIYGVIVTDPTGAGCNDDEFAVLVVNPRPVANITVKKQTICVGEIPTAFIATPNTGVSYKWYGALSDTTSSLGTAISGQTTANFIPGGVATTTPGIKYYAVVVTNTQTSCIDTAFACLVVNNKPNAGADSVGVAAICNSIGTIDLPNAAQGESWSQLGSSPKAVTINPTTGVVTGMDAIGTYQFILKNGTTGCADTVAVETKNCLKGSLGDYVWKDLDDDGVQDGNEPGVKGVIVQLLNGDTEVLLATDTTDNNGVYGFTGLDSGNYKVKIVLSSLPANCQITPKQDAGNPNDDTKDSDFNPAGESPVIVINTLGTGIAKDNPTIDAGLVQPCIKPTWRVTSTPICSPTAATYSVTFSVTNQNGHLKVSQGTLSGNNPYTVTNIPNGTNLIITDSLRANCEFDTTVVAPDCSCPQISLLTPNATACKGDTLPTLKIILVGSNTNGVGANWYASSTGGTALGSGLSFKPSGIITATDTFYVALTGTTGACLDQPRTPVIVLAQACEVDLALKKLINTKIARIGDTLTYTVKVWNEFINDASGVEVTDSIATTVGFIANSFVASRGSAVISGNVITWTIGDIAANGDTVTLTYKVKATQQGIHFNIAEISKTNEKDRDSTPGNGKEEEDDIDRQCFTVPIKLCPGEKVEAGIPAKYKGIKWYKGNDELTALAGQNVVLLEEAGTYRFTAINNACPAEGCCSVIIEPGDNCCPEDLCIPFIIKQTKKGGK
jgi:uncharacterized repeat protein (TIGR01451 family)